MRFHKGSSYIHLQTDPNTHKGARPGLIRTHQAQHQVSSLQDPWEPFTQCTLGISGRGRGSSISQVDLITECCFMQSTSCDWWLIRGHFLELRLERLCALGHVTNIPSRKPLPSRHCLGDVSRGCPFCFPTQSPSLAKTAFVILATPPCTITPSSPENGVSGGLVESPAMGPSSEEGPYKCLLNSMPPGYLQKGASYFWTLISCLPQGPLRFPAPRMPLVDSHEFFSACKRKVF